MDLVAGAFADLALGRIKNSINKYIDDQYEYQTTDVRAKLQHLNKSLTQIQAVVAVAKATQIQEPNLLEWLSQLNDAVYDAEYVMDIFEYKGLKEEVESWPSETKANTRVRNLLRFRCRLPFKTIAATSARRLFFADEELNDLLDVIKKFDGLVAEMPNLTSLLQLHQLTSNSKIQVAAVDLVPDSRVTTSVPDEANLFGRAEAEECLLELLREESEATFSILSVEGVGGVGKTALVQSIFNHSRLRNKYFEVKAWVCVSSNYSIKSLMIHIVEAANIDKPPEFYSLTNLESIQDVLIKGLQSKRFLIVLDDVWEDMEDKWDKICKPFHCGKNGSKILITSRSHNIAKIMGAQEKMKISLSPLNFEDYWILFQKYAFGNENTDNHLQLKKIGEQIARNLGGLPLAAKVMGALLQTNLNVVHWRDVLENKVWKERKGVMSALKLSYDYLPTHLKRIFAYCSLFPKDYVYKAEYLVDIWVALDFVRAEDRSKRLVDIQTTYIDELVSRCFFEQHLSGVNCFHLHDLLHDLAESVSEKEVCRIEDDASSLRREIPSRVRHLYIESNDYRNLDIVLQNVAPKQLRSLVYIDNHTAENREVLGEMKMSECATQKLKGLRSLFLQFSRANVRFSENLCDLLHLRCIHFHVGPRFVSTFIFPTSFWKLYQLQILRWDYLRVFGVNQFSQKIRRINERYANKFRIYNEDMFKGFSHLKKMINLRYVRNPHYNLESLSHLGRLKFLEVIPGGCYYIDGKEGNDIGQLEDLTNIGGELVLIVNVKLGEAEARKSNLKQKQFLNRLGIVDSCEEPEGGIDASTIEALQPHENLEILCISGCRAINKLPTWLPMMFNLKELILENLPSVKQIDVYSKGREHFPSLVKIVMTDMKSLEGWSLPLHDFNHNCFPKLCIIIIERCPKMKFGDSSNGNVTPFPLPTQVNYFIRLALLSSDDLPEYSETSNEEKRMVVLNIDKWWLILDHCHRPTIQQFLSRVKELVFSSEVEYRMDMLLAMLGKLSSLENLTIINYEKLESLIGNNTLQWTTRLKTLVIKGCTLPANLQKLSSLETLVIESCGRLDSLDGYAGTQHLPTSIKKLTIKDCSIKLLSASFGLLSSLESLRIENCYELKSLTGNTDDQQFPASMKNLFIRGCGKLNLPQNVLSSIETVEIHYWYEDFTERQPTTNQVSGKCNT